MRNLFFLKEYWWKVSMSPGRRCITVFTYKYSIYNIHIFGIFGIHCTSLFLFGQSKFVWSLFAHE